MEIELLAQLGGLGGLVFAFIYVFKPILKKNKLDDYIPLISWAVGVGFGLIYAGLTGENSLEMIIKGVAAAMAANATVKQIKDAKKGTINNE